MGWENRGIGRFLLPTLVISVLTLQMIDHDKAHAEGLIETGPFAGLGSLAAYFACVGFDSQGLGSACTSIALLADPPARGITELSMTLSYNNTELVFDKAKSGFLQPFSLDGDNPPVVAREGTVPIDLLPSSGFNPGQPLPGSAVTLFDTGSSVALDYQLPAPVTIAGETNFFLFAFDFKEPVIIDRSRSTVTYLSDSPGADFVQTSFVCRTDIIPDPGCGSENPVKGITFHLTRIPEPNTSLLLATAVAGLVGYGWQRRRRIAAEITPSDHHFDADQWSSSVTSPAPSKTTVTD